MTRDGLLLATAAFAVWALAFVALYGGLSVGCAFGWPAPALRAALLLGFAAALAAGWLVLRRAEACGPGARIAALAGLGASLFTFWPVAALPPCG